MRKFIIMLMLACSTSLYSCFDLDVNPENSVTFEGYFRNENDIKIFMNSIKYDFRAICASNGESFQSRKGMYTDEINDYLISYIKGLDADIYKPNVMSFNWSRIYEMIQSTNVLLENITNAKLPKEIEDMYVGQAYFYRAYGYFYVAQLWGDAPLVLNSRDVKMRAKSHYTVIIAQSILDTQEALKRLPYFKDLMDEGRKSISKQLPTKELIFALQTHLYAWEAAVAKRPESWTLAINAATELLKSKQYFDLAASPDELCVQTLKGVDHKESIFEVDMSLYDNPKFLAFTPARTMISYPVAPLDGIGDIKYMAAMVTNETVDRMFPKGDLRRDAYFYKTDDFRDDESVKLTEGFAFPYKFRYPYVEASGENKGMLIGLDQRRIMFRVADIILLRAEAYVNNNQPALAIADLNTVRRRANAKEYDASEYDGDLKKAVFKEREKELLWETYRYYDIVRNGYYSEISPAFGRLTSKDIEDGAFYLPVCVYAFTDNPMMTQNKYWLSKY